LQRVCPMVLASSYKWVTFCWVKDGGHATMQSEFVHAPNIQSGPLTLSLFQFITSVTKVFTRDIPSSCIKPQHSSWNNQTNIIEPIYGACSSWMVIINRCLIMHVGFYQMSCQSLHSYSCFCPISLSLSLFFFFFKFVTCTFKMSTCW
jgi:hypothetical protein